MVGIAISQPAVLQDDLVGKRNLELGRNRLEDLEPPWCVAADNAVGRAGEVVDVEATAVEAAGVEPVAETDQSSPSL